MLNGISVIVPVYNEPQNIEKTLQRIYANIRLPKEVILVYDSESDTTLPVLEEIKADFKDLRVLKNNIYPGPSGALITGFNVASKAHTLVMMADLCDDITDVDNILTKFSPCCEVISFSRFSEGGSAQLNKPRKKFNKVLIKHYLKIILPKLASLIMGVFGGLKITDPTNSYKIYSTQMLKSLNLKSRTSFSVTLEIIMKAKALGYRFNEVPTKWTDREFGKTNFPLVKSLIAYLPWFCIIFISNRIYSLPMFILKKWFLK